ncbi:MAG: hypothetical protein Q8Q09_05715 [Deltaproteobacteria bacterium]|nr:hypothetical protein [Deltaproteobacteria bacterium]
MKSQWFFLAALAALHACTSPLVGGRCLPEYEQTVDFRCVRRDASLADGTRSDASDAANDHAQLDGDGAVVVAMDGGDSGDAGRVDDSGDVAALPTDADDVQRGDVPEAGCTPPQQVCEGTCVSISSDVLHCGICGRSCAMGEFCVLGTCTPRCLAPLVECDGFCVDPNTDPNHCGMCGVVCPSGICNGGRCRSARAGHIVQLGGDYASSRTPQDLTLENAVALASRGLIRALVFSRYSDPPVVTRVQSLVDRAFGMRLRRTVLADESTLSRDLTIDAVDALIVYDQPNATPAQMSTIALAWASPITSFTRAGGTVILMDGANPTHGTWMISRATTLLPIDSAEDADDATVQLLSRAAGDAVASGVDVLYRGSRNMVRYQGALSYAVFADANDVTRPMILHRAVLP